MKNKLIFTLIISTFFINYIFPVDLEEIKREFSSLGITSNNYEQFYNKIKILCLKDKQDEIILDYYEKQ
ncbi:MAG: hypothetical protein KAT05_17000 [Spirochaetes bacterium]|nr:hypothetical protein [Spirochaetota bacterium]